MTTTPSTTPFRPWMLDVVLENTSDGHIQQFCLVGARRNHQHDANLLDFILIDDSSTEKNEFAFKCRPIAGDVDALAVHTVLSRILLVSTLNPQVEYRTIVGRASDHLEVYSL